MKFLRYVGRYLPTSQIFTDCKYILEDLNWNDYGYYTSYRLYRPTLGGDTDILPFFFLAKLNVVKCGLEAGETHWFSDTLIDDNAGTQQYCSFITNIESAYVMLLFLTPEERKELIDKFRIKFRSDFVKSEPAFKNSLLRNVSEEDFVKRQKEIEKIVTCPLNIAKAISAQKDQIKALINNF